MSVAVPGLKPDPIRAGFASCDKPQSKSGQGGQGLQDLRLDDPSGRGRGEKYPTGWVPYEAASSSMSAVQHSA
jgi:hypothetical protein